MVQPSGTSKVTPDFDAVTLPSPPLSPSADSLSLGLSEADSEGDSLPSEELAEDSAELEVLDELP